MTIEKKIIITTQEDTKLSHAELNFCALLERADAKIAFLKGELAKKDVSRLEQELQASKAREKALVKRNAELTMDLERYKKVISTLREELERLKKS